MSHFFKKNIRWNVSKLLGSVSTFLFSSVSKVVAATGAGDGEGGCPTGKLCNPLRSNSINEFLLKIIDVLLTFALPIIIFFIMYGGFKLVTARGDAHAIEEGRAAITWAVIGGVIVLGAKLIIGVIQGTVTAL